MAHLTIGNSSLYVVVLIYLFGYFICLFCLELRFISSGSVFPLRLTSKNPSLFLRGFRLSLSRVWLLFIRYEELFLPFVLSATIRSYFLNIQVEIGIWSFIISVFTFSHPSLPQNLYFSLLKCFLKLHKHWRQCCIYTHRLLPLSHTAHFLSCVLFRFLYNAVLGVNTWRVKSTQIFCHWLSQAHTSTKPPLHPSLVRTLVCPASTLLFNLVYTLVCQPQYLLTLGCPSLLCHSLQCLQALKDGKQSKPCPSLHYTVNV